MSDRVGSATADSGATRDRGFLPGSERGVPGWNHAAPLDKGALAQWMFLSGFGSLVLWSRLCSPSGLLGSAANVYP